MATGKCLHCGHEPVAVDAPICPRCAGVNPNPGRQTNILTLVYAIVCLGFVTYSMWYLWKLFK